MTNEYRNRSLEKVSSVHSHYNSCLQNTDVPYTGHPQAIDTSQNMIYLNHIVSFYKVVSTR